MPIYERGKSFMVSVGAGHTRYRQTFATRQEAEIAELHAIARFKASGSPLEAPRTIKRERPEGWVLKDAHDLTWRLRWNQDKPAGQKTHRIFCKAVFAQIPEDTPLSEINFDMALEAVEAWEEEGNGGQTVNHKISHLSVMLNTALEKGWINAMPRLPRRKPGKHRVRWMDEQEEAQALALCGQLGLHDLRDLIIVAIDTGFRRGELLGLRRNDYVNGMLHLHAGETKTDKARAVPVTQRVADILVARFRSSNILFGMTVSQLRRQWLDLKTAMRLDDDSQFCVHMLRHTCASRMVQRGVPLAVVQAWMGHSTINTTMRYAHLAPSSLQAGREALEQVKPIPHLMVANG
jgi:integrase